MVLKTEDTELFYKVFSHCLIIQTEKTVYVRE